MLRLVASLGTPDSCRYRRGCGILYRLVAQCVIERYSELLRKAAFGRNQIGGTRSVASAGTGHTATTERGPPDDIQHSRSSLSKLLRPRRSVALHITRKHARKTRARSPIRDYTEKSASRPLRPGGLCNCQFMAEQSLITTGSFATAGQQLAAIAALACSFGGRLAAGAAGALAIRPALAIVATRARAGSRLAASAVGALAIRPTLAFVATRARAGRFRTARATLALATCRALAVLATLASANFRMALAHIAGANRLASTVGNRLLCRDSRYNQRAQ